MSQYTVERLEVYRQEYLVIADSPKEARDIADAVDFERELAAVHDGLTYCGRLPHRKPFGANRN